MQSYRELIVWQKGMDLVEESYRAVAGFPTSELYGLSSQIRRAAVSVPANIAEGWARESTKDYLRHLSIAFGSLAELETLFLIAQRLGFLSPNTVSALLRQMTEIGRMITNLRKSLRAKLSHRGGQTQPPRDNP